MIETCPHWKEEGENPAGVETKVRKNTPEKLSPELSLKDERAVQLKKRKGRKSISGGGVSTCRVKEVRGSQGHLGNSRWLNRAREQSEGPLVRAWADGEEEDRSKRHCHYVPRIRENH